MMEFTLSNIQEAWDRGSYDSAQALIRWNKDASRFGARELPTVDSSLCLQMLQQEGILEEGGTGLDVGCGGGQYSFALEQYGFSMHGTDFSPNMIGEAERNRDTSHSRSTFSVNDWHNLDLQEKGWVQHFDLVLAHMTPAIISGETFLKLIEASRHYVFIQKPTRRKSPLLKEICELLGAGPAVTEQDTTFAQAFSMAWLMGYSPKTGYRDTVWQTEMSVEEAASFYLSRLSPRYRGKPNDTEKIQRFLSRRFPDGTVTDVTSTHLAAMLFSR